MYYTYFFNEMKKFIDFSIGFKNKTKSLTEILNLDRNYFNKK